MDRVALRHIVDANQKRYSGFAGESGTTPRGMSTMRRRFAAVRALSDVEILRHFRVESRISDARSAAMIGMAPCLLIKSAQFLQGSWRYAEQD